MNFFFKLHLIFSFLLMIPFLSQAATDIDHKTIVTEIYVATFERAPAYSGLMYWANAVETGAFTIEQVAQSFFDQPETQAKFPQGSSNTEFIETIYNNSLSRAPGAAGLAYWVAALDDGVFRRDQAIIAILNGAKAVTGSSEDAAMLAKKTEIGLSFADSEIGKSDTNVNFMDWSKNIIMFAKSSDFNLKEAEEYIVELSSSGIKSLSVGADHTAFVKADGSLWAFGENGEGQLGIGNENGQSSSIMIGSNYNIVSAGRNHTLAIDDSGSLWAWGSFQFGQLGNGMDVLDIEHGDSSYITSPIQVDAGSKYIAISAGEYYSLGIKDDNSLWAWGSGMSSKLGNGIVDNQKLPVKIGDNFKAVAAGDYHTLAIKTDGSLWAWGRNMYGEVGHGGSFGYHSGQDTPVQISAPGDQFKAIAAGGYNSLAIKEDGSLWTWGRTEDGKLGLGEDADNPGYPATSNQNSPVKIPISGNFVSIDIGSWHSVALQDNGDIWSWGHNSRGELGVEASAGEDSYGSPILTDRFSPTLMGHDYIAIGAGAFNTVAIKKDISVDSCGKISLEGEEAVYKYFLTYGIFQ